MLASTWKLSIIAFGIYLYCLICLDCNNSLTDPRCNRMKTTRVISERARACFKYALIKKIKIKKKELTFYPYPSSRCRRALTLLGRAVASIVAARSSLPWTGRKRSRWVSCAPALELIRNKKRDIIRCSRRFPYSRTLRFMLQGSRHSMEAIIRQGIASNIAAATTYNWITQLCHWLN